MMLTMQNLQNRPKVRESVSVIGEVQYATSHIYKNILDIEDYIDRSGGLKTRADGERIYIIKADGSVRLASNNNWFSNQDDFLEAGDTIVIPLDLEYKDGLTLWSAVTQIIYNSAVAVAAIGSLIFRLILYRLYFRRSNNLLSQL